MKKTPRLVLGLALLATAAPAWAGDDPDAAADPPAPAAEPTPAPDEGVPAVDVESTSRLDAEPMVEVEPAPELDVVRTAGGMASVRSQVNDWLVMPEGAHQLEAALVFITAEPSLAGRPLRFTDVAILRLSGRTSVKGKVEIFGGADVLAKQPSYVEEDVLQGIDLGMLAQAGKRIGIGLGVAGGPMLADLGEYGSAEAYLFRKKRIQEILAFNLALGASATTLRYDDKAAQDPWLAEVVVRAETQLRTPMPVFGGWLGLEMRFPIEHGPSRSGADDPIDPQTRVNVSIGMVLAIVDDLDLYTEFSIVDRGDLEDARTTLPILDGGFDQRQLVFGVVRRFGKERESNLIAE